MCTPLYFLKYTVQFSQKDNKNSHLFKNDENIILKCF